MKNNKNENPHLKETKQALITISDLDFNDHDRIKINSPRSLLALKYAGLTQEELYFISFDEFVTISPDIKKLPKEMQIKRFDFYETHRKNKIKEVIELREKIIEKEQKKLSYSEELNKSSLTLSSQNKKRSTSVNNDIKRLEKIKAKNETELLNMIQNEIKKKLIVKRAEEKIQIQREIQKKFMEEQEKKNQEELKKKEKIENEKKKKMLEEEKKLEKLEKERQRKEQELYKKEKEDEENRLKELRKKHEEEEKKKKEYQEKLELMYEENRIKREQKQKELEIKNKERQDYLEYQRICKLKEQEEQNKLKKRKIEKNRKNLENKLNHIRIQYLQKENESKIKKERWDQNKLMKLQQQHEKALKKEEQIKQINFKNQSLEKEKLEKFNAKQEQINLKRQKLAEEMEKEQRLKNLKHQMKREQCVKALENNEEIIQQKKENVLKKIEEKNKILQNVMKEKEKQLLIRKEEHNKKEFLKNENIRRMNLKNEFFKEKTLSQINERDIKIEELKHEKMQIAKEKMKIQNEISAKKIEYTEIIQNLLQKNTLDAETLKPFKNLFPNNPHFETLLQQLGNEKPQTFLTSHPRRRNKNKSNSFYIKKTNTSLSGESLIKNKSTNDLKTTLSNKYSTEKHIEEKVNGYRLLLNKELIKMIQNEEIKENERNRALSLTKDPKEKKILLQLHEKERKEANQKIVEFNE